MAALARGVAFALDDGPDVLVDGDAGLLRNLVDNAVRHNPPRRRAGRRISG